MKVLVIGKGGREHAIVLALTQSQSVKEVYALPGNQGMLPDAKIFIDLKINTSVILNVVAENKIDLVVIGPEDPLVDGLADELRGKGLLVFGPDKKSSQLEGSKIFAKEFMEKYKIPTASYKKVKTVKDVLKSAENFTPPYVLKADGLAAGKGVFICKNLSDLERDARKIFEEKILGSSGDQAILEQFKHGYELSFFVLTNGTGYVSLPMAQDHKKLLNNDQGPNTGGMGTVAPMKITESLYNQIIDQVVKPTVKGLKEEKFIYRGVVFIGIMMTDNGPQVLEYNIRFGDPETQVLLPLFSGDWGQAFESIAKGEIPEMQWKDSAAACVVLAAENYPDQPVKGSEISGDLSGNQDQYFLHAGTEKKDHWVTSGGRVLNAVGLGSTMKEAIEKAYQQSQKAQWRGLQKRDDIGAQALIQK